MTHNYKPVDPKLLLERLGIEFVEKNDVLWASCPSPDHNDSTPSWRMIADPDEPKFGQHRCYGCGFGGWPVHLVEKVLGCSRQDARDWLRDVEVDPPLPFEVAVEFQRSVPVMFTLPSGVRVEPFDQWPEEPREYVRSRGIADWQIARWGIGWTPRRYDEMLNKLAGRIVFPVRTVSGKLISYTGRSYTGSARRFKEPSKSEGADLGAVFGERHWSSKRKIVAVTEGAIDALAIERAFPYSLSIGGIYGSQLAPGHIARLASFDTVIMATDPDRAGESVARELELELRRWVRVLRLELPEGEDPASLSVKDPQALKEMLGLVLRGETTDRYRQAMEARTRKGRRRTEIGAKRN